MQFEPGEAADGVFGSPFGMTEGGGLGSLSFDDGGEGGTKRLGSLTGPDMDELAVAFTGCSMDEKSTLTVV